MNLFLKKKVNIKSSVEKELFDNIILMQHGQITNKNNLYSNTLETKILNIKDDIHKAITKIDSILNE